MRHVSLIELTNFINSENASGRPIAVVMCGVPGSGKTTLAKKLPPDWAYLNADTVRRELYGNENTQGDGKEVFNEFYNRLDKEFKNRKIIVVDNTNCKTQYRNELSKKAKDAGYKVQYWVFEVPLITCLSRNLSRERKVPDAVIKKMYSELTVTKPVGANVITVTTEDNDFRFMVP